VDLIHRGRATASVLLLVMTALAGACREDRVTWPPAPRSATERAMIDAAREAVAQFDGWTDVAWQVERRHGGWRVQAWRIVHPAARGRNRCAPYAVRVIELSDAGDVVAYRNHL